ncbi:MAG: XRE family transcriptional regulator [Firmicutes bacterium]|nr:XRE family transcriptional regulator [Bacillota bacterium]
MIQLKNILKDANITQFDIANELGIRSLSTVNQKINNKSQFTVNEAKLLRDLIKKRTSKNYSIEELFVEEN